MRNCCRVRSVSHSNACMHVVTAYPTLSCAVPISDHWWGIRDRTTTYRGCDCSSCLDCSSSLTYNINHRLMVRIGTLQRPITNIGKTENTLAKAHNPAYSAITFYSQQDLCTVQIYTLLAFMQLLHTQE